MKSPKHVFISFKTEDRDIAHSLSEALKKSGYNVWWQESIQCGQEWHGEIDKAVESAGAIIVLWSKCSMSSRWVKHEASQAMIRGIYTPVPIELMGIETPYNRIQATDLINWSGEQNHPGYQNLLIRLSELMPKPIPFWVQFSNLVWIHRTTVVISIIALTALVLLFKQGQIQKQQAIQLHSQIEKQEETFLNVQRSLDPIKDFEIRITINYGPSVPGVRKYLSFLRQNLLEDTNTINLKWPLTVGTVHYVTETRHLSIFPNTQMWPGRYSQNNDIDFWLNTSFIHLVFCFTKRENLKVENSINKNCDLEVALTNAEYKRVSDNCMIDWNIETNEIELTLTGRVEQYVGKGEIVSVPDLKQCVLRILTDFRSYGDSNGSDPDGIRIGNLDLSFSGRNVSFDRSEIKK